MSDITSFDESSGMSTGEDILAKSSSGETTNSNASHRKRERGPSECSHKVIEKRRRDRINRCLAELGKIIPIPSKKGPGYKQTHGKLEKAEILEMTVEYIMKIQNTQLVSQKEDQVEIDDGLDNYKKSLHASMHSNNKQVNAENSNFPSGQSLSKQTFFSKEKNKYTNLQDITSSVEGRQKLTVQSTVEHNIPLSSDKYMMPLTSPQKMSNTLSVLRSRINSRTQEFRGQANASQPGGENGKYQSPEGVKQAVPPCRPELGNSNMDDNSSTTSSESLEPQTDSSNSSDSGYRTLPRAVSATPLAVGPSSYGIPTYALHPAGTHYIPVLLHPNIPLPPMPLASLGSNQMRPSGMPSPFNFGFMNSFNPMQTKGSVPFQLSNLPPSTYLPSGQHMQMPCSRQLSSEPNIDICGCDEETDVPILHSTSESIGVQTD